MKKTLEDLRGFTLVEVMVAMLILAIGLLGLAGITVVVLRSNSLSQQMSDATNIAADLMDSLTRKQICSSNYQQSNPIGTNCANAIIFSSGTCPALEQAGLSGHTELYPQSTNRQSGGADCGIINMVGSSTNFPQTFDVVAANGLKFATFSDSTDFCSAASTYNLGAKQFFRYYRTTTSTSPCRASISVVVVWKDKKGAWKNVHFTTTQQ